MGQTIADLSSQTDDKQRLDTQDAARVELSEIRTWLNEATNAVQEKQEEKCRRIFERVRAQLKLIDELVTLSQLDAAAKKIESALATVKAVVQKAKQRLDEKMAQVRALKVMNK